MEFCWDGVDSRNGKSRVNRRGGDSGRTNRKEKRLSVAEPSGEDAMEDNVLRGP